MQKSFRSVMLVGGVVLGMASIAARGDGSPSPAPVTPPNASPTPEYVEFVAKWNDSVTKGALDGFVQLMESDLGKKTVRDWNAVWVGDTAADKKYYVAKSQVFHIFAWKKAQPWVAVIDYTAGTYPVVAGGFVVTVQEARLFAGVGLRGEDGILVSDFTFREYFQNKAGL